MPGWSSELGLSRLARTDLGALSPETKLPGFFRSELIDQVGLDGHSEGSDARMHACRVRTGSIACLPRSMWRMMPSLSITKVVRLATRNKLSTPYWRETLFSVSHSRGNVSLILSANLRLAADLLTLIPRTWAPERSKSARPSWYALSSFVQPGVLA